MRIPIPALQGLVDIPPALASRYPSVAGHKQTGFEEVGGFPVGLGAELELELRVLVEDVLLLLVEDLLLVVDDVLLLVVDDLVDEDAGGGGNGGELPAVHAPAGLSDFMYADKSAAKLTDAPSLLASAVPTSL